MSASYTLCQFYKHFLSLLASILITIKLFMEIKCDSAVVDDLYSTLFCKISQHWLNHKVGLSLPASPTPSSLASWSPWLGSTDSRAPPPAVDVPVVRELHWSPLKILIFYFSPKKRSGPNSQHSSRYFQFKGKFKFLIGGLGGHKGSKERIFSFFPWLNLTILDPPYRTVINIPAIIIHLRAK